MAKMKTKKIIALLLACCLAFSLVAGGGSFGNDAAAADGAASGGSDTITAIANSEGVVYCSADTYSAGLRDAFIAACQSKGLEIVAEESVDTMTEVDYTSQFNKMVSAGAELVFTPFYYPSI